MINQKVIDMLVWVYSAFDIKLLTVIATGFTIYFGYQKVSRKICVSYSVSTSRIYAMHVTNLVIANKRDNSVVISSILLRIGNKGRIQLVKFDEPLILKGYEAKLVDVPKYSAIYDKNGPIGIDVFESLLFSITTMSGEVIECDVQSPVTMAAFEEKLYTNTVRINDIVLTDRMAFIFSYLIGGVSKDVVIDRGGLIAGKTPFKGNMIQDLSKEFFENFLVAEGYHNYYENYALYKINDNLHSELVLSKAMVSAALEKKNK